MSTVINRIVLKSPANYGKNVPPEPFGEILRLVPGAVARAIRMAFEGRSTARGKAPRWLAATSDIRLVDYSGDDETVLHFACKPLGEAAPELYQQREFPWAPRPSQDDTGFDLLGDVLADVSQTNADSERFDRSLLRQLSRFGRGLDTFQELDVTSRRYTECQPAVLTPSVVEAAARLNSETPHPSRAHVVGVLDMLRASTQAFALKLDDGQEVRGVLTAGEIGQYKRLLEKRVVIHGKAIFRPSGRLLRVDAQDIQPASADDTFFSQMPRPHRRRLELREVLREQSHKRGVAAIIGKWPGDETDDQIAEALRELDR